MRRIVQTPARRAIERASRCAILTVFAVGFRRRDPGAIVNAVFAFAGTYLPRIAEDRYDVELRPWQRAYLATAMVTHAVGMLGPYDDVWWWDHLTHTHSATLLGGITFAVARRRDRDPRPRVITVVVAVGTLWELVEYAAHATADRFGFEPPLVSYGKADTVLDLCFNLFGALLVLAFGDRLLGNVTADEP